MIITYRSHHETDTVIGHSLGGAVAFIKFRKTYNKEGNNPYGIVQSKTFGAPVVSCNLGSSLGKVGKIMVKDEIIGAGVAGGAITGGAKVVLLVLLMVVY